MGFPTIFDGKVSEIFDKGSFKKPGYIISDNLDKGFPNTPDESSEISDKSIL